MCEVSKDNASANPPPKPPVILPLLNCLLNQPPSKTLNDESCLNNQPSGIMKLKLSESIENNETDTNNSNALCETLTFSEEEIKNVDKITLKQWQCKEWNENKAGFISASKCKNVYTRQKTLEKHLKNDDVSCLVNKIIHAKKVSHIHMQVNHEPCTPREWGLTHEDSARNAYFRLERHKHHKIQLEPHGLLISNKKHSSEQAWITSVDAKALIIAHLLLWNTNCPWKHRDLQPKEAFLTKEICGVKVGEEFKLLQKSQYYFQVQLQMFVANIFLCDL
jgi:hypothetical protein